MELEILNCQSIKTISYPIQLQINEQGYYYKVAKQISFQATYFLKRVHAFLSLKEDFSLDREINIKK